MSSKKGWGFDHYFSWKQWGICTELWGICNSQYGDRMGFLRNTGPRRSEQLFSSSLGLPWCQPWMKKSAAFDFGVPLLGGTPIYIGGDYSSDLQITSHSNSIFMDHSPLGTDICVVGHNPLSSSMNSTALFLATHGGFEVAWSCAKWQIYYICIYI